MRVLLVENDTLIGNGLKMGLPKHGFAIDRLKDGRVGRDALSAADYDAVILDHGLPGVDGLDILRAWRASGNDIPLSALTARDALSRKVEGLNPGADDLPAQAFRSGRGRGAIARAAQAKARDGGAASQPWFRQLQPGKPERFPERQPRCPWPQRSDAGGIDAHQQAKRAFQKRHRGKSLRPLRERIASRNIVPTCRGRQYRPRREKGGRNILALSR